MARIELPVSDAKVIEYLADKFGYAPGRSESPVQVDIDSPPDAANASRYYRFSLTTQYVLGVEDTREVFDASRMI